MARALKKGVCIWHLADSTPNNWSQCCKPTKYRNVLGEDGLRHRVYADFCEEHEATRQKLIEKELEDEHRD